MRLEKGNARVGSGFVYIIGSGCSDRGECHAVVGALGRAAEDSALGSFSKFIGLEPCNRADFCTARPECRECP